MSNKKVKLGDKANSFFDPISKLKVLPGQIIEVDKTITASKKVIIALQQGHLQYTDDDTDNAGVLDDDAGVTGTESKKQEDVFDPSKIEVNEKGIKGLKKPELIKLALFNKVSYIDEKEETVSYTQEELEELNAKELKEILLEE